MNKLLLPSRCLWTAWRKRQISKENWIIVKESNKWYKKNMPWRGDLLPNGKFRQGGRRWAPGWIDSKDRQWGFHLTSWTSQRAWGGRSGHHGGKKRADPLELVVWVPTLPFISYISWAFLNLSALQFPHWKNRGNVRAPNIIQDYKHCAQTHVRSPGAQR